MTRFKTNNPYQAQKSYGCQIQCDEVLSKIALDENQYF